MIWQSSRIVTGVVVVIVLAGAALGAENSASSANAKKQRNRARKQRFSRGAKYQFNRRSAFAPNGDSRGCKYDDVQALAALSSAELRDKLLLLLLSKNKSALTTADITALKATTESVPTADASGESSPSATAGGLQTSGSSPASQDIASVWSRASN